jgi:hypothetical protein
MIYIENKKKQKKTLAKLYPNAEVIDVTSKGQEPFVRLSPFYPHGNIPVPFSENIFSFSVEGIWQGLKVFENMGIDDSKFGITNMKGIKRTSRKFGKTIGHRKGVYGTEYLDYLSARMKIYLPSYAWVLQNKAQKEIEMLVSIAEKKDLILLDYETNEDIENIKKPLSHAALIKKFIYKKYPHIEEKCFSEAILTKTLITTTEKKKSEPKKRGKRAGKKNKEGIASGQLNINF